MKYKIGDKVRIKDIDWYNENKDEDGIVELSTYVFTPGMSQFCGKVMTIEDVFEDIDDNGVYYMEEIDYDWTDEMIECKVEEESSIVLTVKGEEVKERIEVTIPEGYEYVIESGKIIFTKKKKEYPKTYEECCEIIHSDPNFYVDTHLYSGILGTLYKLLICRDAYWKIAGEEMGLGKPWEPDWTNQESPKYCIASVDGQVKSAERHIINTILAFPTAEMRDVFYENFKKEIEICKELL